MQIGNVILPALSALVSLSTCVLVLRRFVARRRLHLLLWAVGVLMYGIGGACEAYYGSFGWNAAAFRLWYLFGAILVAAWLGQGTVFLLVRRSVAYVLLALLLAASIYGAVRVLTAQLDPALLTRGLHTGSELSGHAIVTPGVRILTPFFNLYGTIALVGGALWSAYVFWRKRILLHRTLGNILIAVGAILPAFGGTFSRLGIPNALYIGELLGIVLILLGFLRATRPMRGQEEPDQEAAGRG